MIKNKPKGTEKRNKVLTILLIIIWFLLATILIYLNFGRMGAPKNTLPNNNDKIHYQADANATQGDLSKSKFTIVEALNQKVEEGNIAFSMNPFPVFANGKAKGNLLIANSKDNRYPQMVEIYRQDTQQLIYSGGVDIGCKVETGNLLVDLPKGVYNCTTYFYPVDPSTDRRIATFKGEDARITVLE